MDINSDQDYATTFLKETQVSFLPCDVSFRMTVKPQVRISTDGK